MSHIDIDMTHYDFLTVPIPFYDSTAMEPSAQPIWTLTYYSFDYTNLSLQTHLSLVRILPFIVVYF